MSRREVAAARWMLIAVAAYGGSLPAQTSVLPARDRTLECGELANSTGPHDYRDEDPARRWDVNDTKQNHYDPAIVRMREGEYSRRVMHDIDFLLRVFPNHYPALQLVVDYERGGGKTHEYRTTDCYFDRARRFAPEDILVVLMEAAYFRKTGDKARARESYETALAMKPDSADVNYNAGLFYVEIGEYAHALRCAKAAYSAGYPLPGLRRKLDKLGYHIEETDRDAGS